ncbi:ABC-type nitrate/sulfonate/bicarbonate transport system substrate-binding protein [Agrobacterium larrymoorei]|uniref:ABC-type nitrate/sulfonate/bicarbonate transport system substrate-binding protein n=2 Tax=Agrobacterium larrymoorei TaxID=160699 RepID=A0AAJ2BIJ5_9HYPH|nr:CmpA/NrtA family ABC transporter substrate-binding protein [Agrobacterium larrymoorei]MDR6100295.1 ABC-type nitrate/sulfonate/bicarbonate transport system substrate-binding protein [Agrobacterium larrymoorei]
MTVMDDLAEKQSGIAAPAPVGNDRQRTLRAGFIPLVDASVLIAAAEFGFAEKEGLKLDLVKDVSWANVRDRLAFRQFDIAHMLSPMPVASMLGLGSNPSPTITPFSLGRGGNAITLSTALFARMRETTGVSATAGALDNARALKTVLDAMRANGEPMPTLGMTYPFSSHNYEFRYWLAAGGIHPDKDVKLVVVPPPLTSDALAAGAIDGFCVGAPWNMIACERGVGQIVAVKQDIWPSAPEKVIGMRPDWAETQQESVARLLVALDAAARWCDRLENRPALSEALADPRYIGAPEHILRRVLGGEFNIDAQGNQRVIDNYFQFHDDRANYPHPNQALWIYSQMIRWGQTAFSQDGARAASAAYRPDLYRAALGGGDHALQDDDPSVTTRFMDGLTFDPSDIPAYVERFSVKNSAISGLGIGEF